MREEARLAELDRASIPAAEGPSWTGVCSIGEDLYFVGRSTHEGKMSQSAGLWKARAPKEILHSH